MKPAFFQVFFCFFGNLDLLNVFISDYLDKILPWKEMKLAFSVKFQTEKTFALLKIKIRQNPGCPNKEYNAIFDHIHQNIRAYPRSTKFWIDQWLWKYCCIFRTVRAKEGVSEHVWFVLKLFGGSEGWCYPRKIWLFLLSFKLANSIPCTQIDIKLSSKH